MKLSLILIIPTVLILVASPPVEGYMLRGENRFLEEEVEEDTFGTDEIEPSTATAETVVPGSHIDCILEKIQSELKTEEEQELYNLLVQHGSNAIEEINQDTCTPAVVQGEESPMAAACKSVAEDFANVYGNAECLDEFVPEDNTTTAEQVSTEVPPTPGRVRKIESDPYSAKIDICVQALIDLILPITEYNCFPPTVEVCLWSLCFPVPNPACLFLPHCCIPPACLAMPDCGILRTVHKLVASAGDVYCFEDITAGDLWDRVKERAVSVAWSTIPIVNVFDALCPIVKLDIEAMYMDAEPLHSDVIALMEEIREADDTPLPQSWDSAVLPNIKINDKASLGANEFWVQKHAICLGHLVLFRDTIDFEQLSMNPPKTNAGDRVTLQDLQNGNYNDPSGNFKDAISTLLHEMVHARQYSELGICEFYKNYLLDVALNGYDGASYEEEAYAYQDAVAVFLQSPPVAVCKNVVVAAADDSCEAPGSIDDGSYDLDSTISLEQTPPGPYPKGDTNVVLAVTGDYEQTDSCTGVVTVEDRTAPALTCPEDLNVPVNDNCLATVPLEIAAVEDNCDDIPDTTEQGGETVTVGDVVVHTYSATDTSGNTGQCDWTAVAVDEILPFIAAPDDETAECDAVPLSGDAVASDNCEISSVNYDGEKRIDGPCSDAYTLERTWTALDTSNNAASDSQTITVQDTTLPNLTCNVYDITPDEANETDPVHFTPTATDNCDPTVDVNILSYNCFKKPKGGKDVVPVECQIVVADATASVYNTGEVGSHIEFEVEAKDRCGNEIGTTCGLKVVKAPKATKAPKQTKAPRRRWR